MCVCIWYGHLQIQFAIWFFDVSTSYSRVYLSFHNSSFYSWISKPNKPVWVSIIFLFTMASSARDLSICMQKSINISINCIRLIRKLNELRMLITKNQCVDEQRRTVYNIILLFIYKSNLIHIKWMNKRMSIDIFVSMLKDSEFDNGFQ